MQQQYTTEIGTDIARAAKALASGDVVAIPTETVYGLAANALNETAVAKIFEAKQRPFFNPLIIHLASINDIEKYAYIDEISWQLAKQFMPGPLTLLLPKKNIIPNIVTANSNKVAVRIPNHPVFLELLKQIDFPVAAPSANVFGYVSPVTAMHVYKGLQHKISYILDGGNCNIGLESTIIEVVDEDVILHRAGGLAIEDIELHIGKKMIAVNHKDKPVTSGQLKSHYATATPLIQGNVEELIQENMGKKIAIISFCKMYDGVEEEHQFVLSKNENLSEAAQHLFITMQMLDAKDYDIILAEIFPKNGLGIAINDRLHRAQITQK